MKGLYVVRLKENKRFLMDVEASVTLKSNLNGWGFTNDLDYAIKTSYEGAKRYAIKCMIAWYAWGMGFDSTDLEIITVEKALEDLNK